MKRILVTGAGGSAAANFIDALRLANRDYKIVGVDAKPYHLSLTPLDARYIVPPCSHPDYLPTLKRIIAKEKIDFVHPQPDVEVLALAKVQDQLGAHTFLPSLKTIELCQDKAEFNARMKEAGVPVPLAFHITDEQSVKAALREILKHSPKAWLRAVRGAGSKASLPVSHDRHALGWIDYWQTHRGLTFDDFMLSEFLPGKEFAFQSVWLNGKLIVSQARERVEYIFSHMTPSGQSSSPSVARTVNRDDVNDIATRAILAADPNASGIFCVDMKEDGKGEPRVTEINCGRFFTTSNFFAYAGVNMPDIFIQLAFNQEIPNLPAYNPLPENLWWVRMIDMSYGLRREDEWNLSYL